MITALLNYITWTADPILIGHPVTIRWYGLMFVIGHFFPRLYDNEADVPP